MLTLHQTVEIIKNFCSKHLQIKGFYFGDEWEKGVNNVANEIATDGKMAYPFVQAVLQSANKEGNMIARRFTIIVTDLVNKDESNETMVLSDLELICYDLMLYLEQVADSGDIGITITQNTTLTDFTERDDDECSGWFFDITISSHIGNYSCGLPIVPGNYFDGNYIYIGGETGGAFQVLIKDQNGNVLQTFNTSGEYIVEVLNRVRDTITANTETIIDPID